MSTFTQHLIDIQPKDCISFDISDKYSYLHISNVSQRVVSFKIKTTSPSIFFIYPATGSIQHSSTVAVKFKLIKADESVLNRHKFLILAKQINYSEDINWNSNCSRHILSAKILVLSNNFTTNVTKENSGYSNRNDNSRRTVIFKSENKENINDLKLINDRQKENKYLDNAVLKKELVRKEENLKISVQNLNEELRRLKIMAVFYENFENISCESKCYYNIWHVIAGFIISYVVGFIMKHSL